MQSIRYCRKFFVPSFPVRDASNIIINKTEDINSIFVNRNPRNLEKMRIAYKPDGYHVDRPGRNYWHKLNLSVTGKYVTATINHFENGEVLRASTSEWCIKKYLYRTKDTSAFINLGTGPRLCSDKNNILGFRCLQTGLTEVTCDLESSKQDGKIALFLKALEDSGVQLTELHQFKPTYPWDQERPEKPWDVIE